MGFSLHLVVSCYGSYCACSSFQVFLSHASSSWELQVKTDVADLWLSPHVLGWNAVSFAMCVHARLYRHRPDICVKDKDKRVSLNIFVYVKH